MLSRKSLLSLVSSFCVAGFGFGSAQADLHRTAAPHPHGGADIVQGQVVVESFGGMIAVAVDTFDPRTLPDGLADRVFFFETEQSFEPLDVRGMALVEVGRKSLTLRFGDRAPLVLQFTGAPEADAAAEVIAGGFGFIETSKYRGERLDQVAAMARADAVRVLVPRSGGGLGVVTAEDQSPPVEPVQPPSCSTSCSTTCGDGSSCTATCTKNCGSCSCGTGGASCSCS